jgi:dephospho-CoA kinase
MTAGPPYRVGLTGSIASGKSTVARRLKDGGLPVIDLDKVGHEVLRRRHEAFEPVVAEFGQGVLAPDGEIDRKKLGALVFANPAARARLNQIMHPRIREEEARRVAAMAEDGVVAVVSEAALLIETGQKGRFDMLVVVGCSPEIQTARLMKRDHCTAEEAAEKIAAQLTFEQKKAEADWVIDTSGEKEATLAASDVLAAEIRRRAGEAEPPRGPRASDF